MNQVSLKTIITLLTILVLIASIGSVAAKNITTQDVGSHEQCKTALAGAKRVLELNGATCRILDSYTNTWLDVRCQKSNKITFLKCDGNIFKVDEYIE